MRSWPEPEHKFPCMNLKLLEYQGARFSMSVTALRFNPTNAREVRGREKSTMLKPIEGA